MTDWRINVSIDDMEISLTNHAKVRMFQRGITQDDITAALERPDAKNQSFKQRIAVRKKIPAGTLEVIYREHTSKNIIIITCYWIKEA